jgi:hypothetical protein
MTACFLLAACSDYDDSDLRSRIDSVKERLAALQTKADALEAELTSLSYITGGNVISSVTQDSDGKFVITYKDNADKSYSVVIATQADIISQPLMSVGEEDGAYYWTIVANGTSSWLLDDAGNKVPVAGHQPIISISADGYWTIDGKVMTDAEGKPVEATTDETSLFKAASVNADGDLVLTLGDGTVVTLPVVGSMNLKLDVNAVNYLSDLSAVTVNYEVTGNASYSLVDIARANNVIASIDKSAHTVTVSFPSGFASGSIILVAYDLDNKTIIKPVYFYATSSDDVIRISTAADLVKFAADVNSGAAAQVGNVELTQDIDMSSITDWTPIGNATFTWVSNALTISGNAFKGTFDGKGYALRNLQMTCKSAGGVYGLFGALDGATVKNLTIGAASGDNSAFNVNATAAIDAGVIAGLANEASIENVTNYAPITYNGTSGSTRTTVAMVGFIFCKDAPTVITELKNYGKISIAQGGNTTAGATAVHGAGIVGFSTNEANSKICNQINYCTNYGDMESYSARTSGIVAACNKYTELMSCVNRGNQINSFPTSGGSRPGNITCITGTGVTMSDCINYGNLISTTAGRCGGLVSLPNSTTNTFSGCANYGEVITDSDYRGVFYGYGNLACSFINCTASGKLGLYNGGNYLYDEYESDKYENYLGRKGASYPNLSGITYMFGDNVQGGSTETVEPTLRILFIGNSFTKDAVEHLPGLITGADIKSVKMAHMYYGGRTIAEYNSGYATTNDYTYYRANTGWSTWGSYSGYTIQEVVKSDDWDIVTIQEHTGKAVAWNWSDAVRDDINNLIAKIKADQPNKTPKFYYLMSQAYGNPDIYPDYGQINVLKNNFASQEAMYQAIVAQAKHVEAECNVDGIIATGTMLQNLRTSSLNNQYDLTRDGYHMDFGITRYGAACLMFQTLISPNFDNVSLDGNTFRYASSNSTAGSITTPVTDDNRGTAIQAATYAKQTPFAVTSMQ